MYLLAILLAFVLCMCLLRVSPPLKVKLLSKGQLRCADAMFRKDRRDRALQGGLIDQSGNLIQKGKKGIIPYYKLAEFHTRRFITTKAKELDLWATNPQKQKLEWYRAHIKAYEHPGIVNAIIVVLALVDAAILYQILPASAFLGLGMAPVFLVGVTPYELENTGIVKVDDWCTDGSYTLARVQSAVTYAKTNGKPAIYLGPHTYTGGANDKIEFDGNVSDWYGIRFVGAGIDKTILSFTALTNFDGLKFTQSGGGATRCYNITISDMTIKGNANAYNGIYFDTSYIVYMERVKTSFFTKNTYCGIYSKNVYSSIMLYCFVVSCKNGAKFEGSNTMSWTGGQAIYNTNSAIELNGTDLSITDVSTEGNVGGTYSILIFSIDTHITNCYFEGNEGSDIYSIGNPGYGGANRTNTIVGCYHNGVGPGSVPYTDYGIRISNSIGFKICGNTFINHVTASINIGDVSPTYAVTYDTIKCRSIYTENNYTGDFYSGVSHWGVIDPILINITSRSYNAIITERNFDDKIVDAGHFTISHNKKIISAYNNGATAICPGDIVKLDNSVTTGKAILPTTSSNTQVDGVVYDGMVDTLKSNATAGDDHIHVDDITAWYNKEGIAYTIQIRDDAGATEHKTISSIDIATDTITLTTNLASDHTTANHTRILLEYQQNAYSNIITNGCVEYLHVDGTTDIAALNYISNFTATGVGYYGYDFFIAQALEAYSANNSNGLIKAMVGVKRATQIHLVFSVLGGAATESDYGIWINAAGEYSSTGTLLPADITSVRHINITAISGVNETHGMIANIQMNAAAPNEAWNTHGSTITPTSNDVNISIDDVITWTVVPHASTTGGDQLRIRFLYNAAIGDDCATDCKLGSAVLYCI